MSERMTLKKFDSLKLRDFENGAIFDDIRFTVKLCEELYLKWLHGEGKEPDPWEAWVFNEPLPCDYDKWQDWAYAQQKWLLKMPRGK